MIITIDGPAGVGKSSMAKGLSKAFGFAYLDTGAMYRHLGLLFGAGVADMTDEALAKQLEKYSFSLKNQKGEFVLYCNSEPIGDEIRTDKAGRMASVVAALPLVRMALQKYQREIAENTSVVAEGRDMGTVVFPDATVKFFLDASLPTRGKRRFLEMKDKNMEVDYDTLLESIGKRDLDDRERSTDPLRAAEDAFLVDTTDMEQADVLAFMVRKILATSNKFNLQENSAKKTVFVTSPNSSSILNPSKPLGENAFSHLDGEGNLRMVAVEEKKATLRKALAKGFVRMNTQTVELLRQNALPKGDVLTVAKVAGIMGAKRTADMIPLCHPLLLSFVDVNFTVHEDGVEIVSEVRTFHNTGVEMEAIVAVQVAASTIYDMAKAVQKDMIIENIQLIYKEGGKAVYSVL